MKMLLIAATLCLSTNAVAQTAAQVDAGAQGKINTAMRADVAARTVDQAEAPATIGNVRVKTARMGEKTVKLEDGGLPDKTAMKGDKPGG